MSQTEREVPTNARARHHTICMSFARTYIQCTQFLEPAGPRLPKLEILAFLCWFLDAILRDIRARGQCLIEHGANRRFAPCKRLDFVGVSVISAARCPTAKVV